MTPTNPFTQRGRITEPVRFAGRWAELSLIFDQLEQGRPVLISGAPGIGKSSLLTHIVQSAGANLEDPELRAFYLDIRGAQGAAEVYRSVVAALGGQGENSAALEVALLDQDASVLLCLDNAQAPLEAGWGAGLLEALARVARGGALSLAVALTGPAPQLSERFATIGLGALAPAELRLLADAYLDETGVSFTPSELHEIAALSAGHPAYVQRAAYHLFQSKLDPSISWRAAYIVESRERPVPGAPLPPTVFSGAGLSQASRTEYGRAHAAEEARAPEQLPLPEDPPIALVAPPLAAALLVFMITSNLILAVLGAALGAVAVLLWRRRRHT